MNRATTESRLVNGRWTLPPRRNWTPAEAARAEAIAAEHGIELPGNAEAERSALQRLAWARRQSRYRPPNAAYRSFLQAVAREAANHVRAARARAMAEQARA